jgi:hypothetical protein
MPLAIDFPSPEFIIFAIAILLGVVGKLVEFAKHVRQKSIEAQQRDERRFGEDLGEAAEPPRPETPPVRLELVRRPLPRREPVARPSAPPAAPVRPPRPPVIAPEKPRAAHPVLRLLRDRGGARDAIVLAEILGPPKSLRRGR